MSVWFGIFRPEQGYHIDSAVHHMVGVAALLENTHNIDVVILKSIDQSWVAVFASCREDYQSADTAASILPEAAAFTKGLTCRVKIVDSGLFQPSSNQSSEGVQLGHLSVGNTMSVRRIYTSWKSQEVLSYSCLAILRSYFNSFKGLFSCSFYDSLDGKQIIGLGVWESVEAASANAEQKGANPATVYWRALGAKKMEYDVCRVCHVTCSTSN